MNLLITSVGRRTQLLKYFKKELKGIGNLIATDCSKLAPALYIADKAHIVPRIDDESYIDTIKNICHKEEINGIFSLIDPELSIIAKHEKEFLDIGVTPFISPYNVCEICFDKYAMFEFCKKNNFKSALTFIDIEDFKKALSKQEISFPVFVKPRCGSASIGVKKIYSMKELNILVSKYNDLIIQQFLDGQEYGADVYVDMLSGEVISIFTKKKIAMRSGETDKSVSVKDDKLFTLIKDFVKKLGIRGQADLDIFEVEGEYYISEINPRFGGGYLHAYECGCNFPKYIINNLKGITNKPEIGNYEENIYMMKHDTVMMKREEDLNGKRAISDE